MKRKKRSSVPVRVLKMIFCAILLAALLFGSVIIFLTVTEWKPADRETLTVEPAAENDTVGEDGGATQGQDSGNAAAQGQDGGENVYRVMSWNIGYGALGDNADFFMDGGKMVKSADKERVEENLSEIIAFIRETDPDFTLVQETDGNATRSYGIDEALMIASECGGYSNFALNFNTFVPYPLPPIGKVRSGLLTLSEYEIGEAERIQLPIPFKWPVRVANLKRCLSVNRIDLPDTDRELVLINLHLEAYDSGEGKILQTEMLKEVLEAEYEAGNYVIAGGDFNQLFSSCSEEALRRYPVYENRWQPGYLETDAFGEHWQFVVDPEHPSCRSLDQPYAGADQEHFQYYLIDGFIVSDNVHVKSAETIDLGFHATDHNPVVMDFTV